ncbi:PREDICTED: uncharacterized protein LOC105152413 isoform X3 [Acromyrmex echinatior]|uniref:uncharacterized protein LOC105152413 isoform X3 n=1 Tax=Acromyrmex echinatior TaxID=103372 RepID=UPI000580D61A|nr:PREDICTED: uncharacterized protein LOC105152413 isoform X3 [Acromyrmex echinatior]
MEKRERRKPEDISCDDQSGYISSTAVHWQPLALFGCRACLGSLISNRIISGARATGMSHGARENQNGKRKRKR